MLPGSRTGAGSGQVSLRPITAVATAHRIDVASLKLPLKRVRSAPFGALFAVSDEVQLFVFGFGALVLDGSEGLDDVADLVAPILLETQETYWIRADPERAEGEPRVGWDRVVIPADLPELVAAVALLLGQSAALERYEHAADALLEETLELSRLLARKGRLPLGTRELIERLGVATGSRLELARWFYLVDRPEETWESAQVARLYDALFANLELRQRHDAMLHKLGAAERATQAAIDMWHGQRSNALEWVIVILIVVEIVFGVLGVL